VPIPAGTLIEPRMLDARRPGTGLPAETLPQVCGRRTRVAIAADALIDEEMLA